MMNRGSPTEATPALSHVATKYRESGLRADRGHQGFRRSPDTGFFSLC